MRPPVAPIFFVHVSLALLIIYLWAFKKPITEAALNGVNKKYTETSWAKVVDPVFQRRVIVASLKNSPLRLEHNYIDLNIKVCSE